MGQREIEWRKLSWWYQSIAWQARGWSKLTRWRSPPNLRAVEETKDKAPTQEMDGESCPNKSICTTSTIDSMCRHPFTDSIIGVSLSDKWKGFNRDRYDGTTDPGEHMDAYTTHMSMYTSDNVILCQVFPTSLKGGALSWFIKLPTKFVDSFATQMSKFKTQFATS